MRTIDLKINRINLSEYTCSKKFKIPFVQQIREDLRQQNVYFELIFEATPYYHLITASGLDGQVINYF
jgi:hypothetical protein